MHSATTETLTHCTKCLFCSEVQSNARYTCRCLGESWQREYRSMDIHFTKNNEQRFNEIRKSFETYDFQDPRGMLQYTGLPYQSEDHEAMRVGLTPLYALENISELFGVNLFIKSEGQNPSGCFKDRETLLCLLNARHMGMDKATIFSSGNAAASAAIFAQKNNFHLITFVSGDTYREKIAFIAAHGSDVIVIGDKHCNFETGYRLYSELSAEGLFADRRYDNWSVRNPYRVQGDKTIALEIVKQFEEVTGKATAPDFVAVPTANGSCLAGTWKGFRELFDAGIIDTLPRMIAIGIKHASPVFKAVANQQFNRPVKCDLSRVDHDDAGIGSIILAAEGYDSIEAAKAVNQSAGAAIEVTKQDIEDSFQLFLESEGDLARDEDILPEPAGVISISAIDKLRQSGEIPENALVVSIFTGSGVKARQKVRQLTPNDADTETIVEEILDRKMENQYPDAKREGSILHVDPDKQSVISAFDAIKR